MNHIVRGTAQGRDDLRSEVVGAAGFEPAAPCAQGKLGRAFEVLISEQFATVESLWAHFWDHPFGDALLQTAN